MSKITTFQAPAINRKKVGDMTVTMLSDGHTGYLIGEGKESLLIWGDIVHFPHVQMAQPDVTIALDSDPTQASKTRKRLLEQLVSDKLLVPACTSTLLLPAG